MNKLQISHKFCIRQYTKIHKSCSSTRDPLENSWMKPFDLKMIYTFLVLFTMSFSNKFSLLIFGQFLRGVSSGCWQMEILYTYKWQYLFICLWFTNLTYHSCEWRQLLDPNGTHPWKNSCFKSEDK